jgi:hypothetical protein
MSQTGVVLQAIIDKWGISMTQPNLEFPRKTPAAAATMGLKQAENGVWLSKGDAPYR